MTKGTTPEVVVASHADIERAIAAGVAHAMSLLVERHDANASDEEGA